MQPHRVDRDPGVFQGDGLGDELTRLAPRVGHADEAVAANPHHPHRHIQPVRRTPGVEDIEPLAHLDRCVMSWVDQQIVELAAGAQVEERAPRADPLPGLAFPLEHQLARVAGSGVAPLLKEAEVEVAIVERSNAAMPLVAAAEAESGWLK